MNAFDNQDFRSAIEQHLSIDPGERTDRQVRQFIEKVGHYKFFHNYSDSQQQQLGQIATFALAKKDDVLFKQDDTPDRLYLVVAGRVSLYKVQGEIKKVTGMAASGDSFGDLSHLDEKHKRSCYAQVLSDDVHLIVFEREDLDLLAHEWRASEEGLKTEFISKSLPVLNSVPREQLFGIASMFERVKVSKDTVIYRQQDDASAIYFIWEGSVQVIKRIDLVKVTKKGGGKGGGLGSMDARRSEHASINYEIPTGPRRMSKSIQMGSLSPGEYFGEVEVFNEIPRTSATISTTDCVLLVLNKVSIDQMPSTFLDAMYRYSYQRVQWRNSRINLLFDCLANINWVPERDAKLTMEPEIKPLAKMKTAMLPLATQPGSDKKGWLGAHTVMADDDAREWGLYCYGPWARPPDKVDLRFVSGGDEEQKNETAGPGAAGAGAGPTGGAGHGASRRPLPGAPSKGGAKDGFTFFMPAGNKIGDHDGKHHRHHS